MIPIKIKAMQRNVIFISFLNQNQCHLQLCASSIFCQIIQRKKRENKICLITCFCIIDPSGTVSFSKGSLIFWHHQPDQERSEEVILTTFDVSLLVSTVVLAFPTSFLLLCVSGFLFLFSLSHRIKYSSCSGDRKLIANSFITNTDILSVTEGYLLIQEKLCSYSWQTFRVHIYLQETVCSTLP